ncbi:VOC family protein [Amycolatopsis sp. CA-128772]|uniref:VOC family protein n=1 Tax=Amycolatopsis sp. CA-128772 TaxID=2073159 RepID=UPI001E2A893F|nr:VOC family protein [Amycolatopsis sp. CA-128772]
MDGAPRIGVQLAPDHVPPQWPDGPVRQQVHLDLWVENFAEAHEQVMALGATVLKPAAGTTTGNDFQVYTGPAGHPFDLLEFLQPDDCTPFTFLRVLHEAGGFSLVDSRELMAMFGPGRRPDAPAAEIEQRWAAMLDIRR